MGMSAEVLAVGPFRRALVSFLRHPPECYEATREGAILVERVLYTPEGNTRSRELAACFGIDPWDFSAHALDPWRADLDRLRALFNRDAICPAHEDSGPVPACKACVLASPVEKLLALREAGHEFFFRPNG